MIPLTKLHGEAIVVNAEHVLYLEQMPDTILVLTNGQRLPVRESPEEVVERVRAFKRSFQVPALRAREEDG